MPALVVCATITACAPIVEGTANLGPSSPQTIEYYPHLVKGYQSTYPSRRIVILVPTDGRKLETHKQDDAQSDEPQNGTSQIGVTVGSNDEVLQNLRTVSLATVVQAAIEQAADEAGLSGVHVDKSAYSEVKRRLTVDYVLESRITRAWVKKQRGPDSRYGPTWQTQADFALEVTIYKPPFRVAFWQGTSADTYYDPPLSPGGLSPADLTGIYDEPGQVLSIALTRAVAGIFKKDELRSLIQQDRERPR